MAFFRFSRDKRGYEHFYLVQPMTNRRGKVRSRVLYWFRTPPGVRVGREPFDEGVRRALEKQNPDVIFDWPAILGAPIPSADADKWRERRRVERAAKQNLAASDGAELEEEPAEADHADHAGAYAGQQTPPQPADRAAAPEVATAPEVAAAPTPSVPLAANRIRKRRRRRGGRRAGAPAQPGPPAQSADASEPADLEDPGEPTGE